MLLLGDHCSPPLSRPPVRGYTAVAWSVSDLHQISALDRSKFARICWLPSGTQGWSSGHKLPYMAPTAAFRALAPALLERLASRVTATGDSVTIPAPSTGDDLATLPQSTAADVRKAYDSAREAQRAWAALPVAERVKPFLALTDAIVDRREEVLDIVQ